MEQEALVLREQGLLHHTEPVEHFKEDDDVEVIF